MEWDEFKGLYQNDNLEPTVGEIKKWLSTKDDFYYQMITDPKEKNPYYKSMKYDTCTVQFELRFQEDSKSYLHNYLLSWSADGQKYSLNFAISTHVLANTLDSMQVAELMINAYGTEMEKAGRPPGEIKCMADFIRKIANTGKQNHYSSPTYQYMEIDDWQYKNQYASGGYVMSKGGFEGPGFKLGNGTMYVNDYAIYDEAFNGNYRQPEVDILPGVKEVVKHPVTGQNGTVENIIINLNDSHMWTRDQIADWLETLDVDLTFKDEPAKVEKKRKHNEALGYHKGEKISYKPTNVTKITEDTVSIGFKMEDVNLDALKLYFGESLVSKEEFLKQIGGDTE